MALDHFQASGAPAPGGSYSHGVVAHGFLYTCGMGPVDPATGSVVEGGIVEQTRQTLKNLQAILSARGTTFADVIKVTAHQVCQSGDGLFGIIPIGTHDDRRARSRTKF